MEQEDDKKKKLNEDVVVFMRKRSETEAPRYTARLKTYVDIQRKHRRAAVARSHSDYGFKKTSSTKRAADGEKQPLEPTGEAPANEEDRLSRSSHLRDLFETAPLRQRPLKIRGRLEKDLPEKGLTKKGRNGKSQLPGTFSERGRVGEKALNRERSMSHSRSGAPSDRCCKRRRRRSRCGRRRKARRRRRSCRRRRRRSCRRRRRRSCRRRRRSRRRRRR